MDHLLDNSLLRIHLFKLKEELLLRSMSKKKQAAKETKEVEEKTDEAVIPLIDDGSASIIFSPSYNLPTIISFCNLQDLGLTVSRTNKTWDRIASTMTHVWDDAVKQCYKNIRIPQWYRNSSRPRELITNLSQSCFSRAIEETKTESIELSLPKDVVNNIISWKQDVIQESEEVGVKNYCRWDLIDAVQNDSAIHYTFQMFGNDIYFTAYNEAASRLGVTSSYFKTWIRGSNVEDSVDSHMVVIATIDSENYKSYSTWMKRNGKNNSKSVLPKNTYNGSVVFQVHFKGPNGRATVDWHTA